MGAPPGLECKTRSSSWRASSRSSKTTTEGHVQTKKKQSTKSRVQSSLKKEILQLEKWLQDQFMVQHELEKVLGHRFSSHEISNENSLPKGLNITADQTNVFREAFYTYYDASTELLQSEHTSLRQMEHENAKILNTKGELNKKNVT